MARQLERFDNLIALFLARAEEKGDAPFLWARRDGQWRSTSWAEAAREVAALAASLKGMGLERGDRVALVSENRPEWLISDLAIMAAGCVTVPTYTTNTTRDHAHILGNSGARAVIVSNQKLAKNLIPAVLNSSDCHHIIGIEEIRSGQLPDWVSCHQWSTLVTAGDVAALKKAVAGMTREDLACIIYTSGTGGAPRGVQQHHGAILHNLEGATDIISTDFGWDDEVFLSFLPASHAYEHMGGQMFPIALGAQVYYAESLEKLAANIEEVQPTIMVVVPRLFEMLRARILKSVEGQGGLSKYLLHRALKIGGDRYNGRLKPWDMPMDGILSLTLRKKIRQRFGGRQKAWVSGGAPLNPEVGVFFQSLGITFLQGYGQTEAAPADQLQSPKRRHPPRYRRAAGQELRGPYRRGWRDHGPRRECDARLLAQSGRDRAGPQGRLAGDGRRRPFRRQGPDRHHRPQEGHPRQRQGRQCLAAADRGHADPPSRDRPGDGLWRPPAAPGGAAGPGSGNRRNARPAAAAPGARSTASMPIYRSSRRSRRFILADDAFTIENEQLTPSMKIRRHVISSVYGERLDALYKR